MRQSFFVPFRELPAKNKALSLKRQEGYNAARGCDSGAYGAWVREVKKAVILAARAAKLKPPTHVVDICVTFWLFPTWDDDAGALALTWVIDGLVDAGLWRRDRRMIRWAASRVVREHQGVGPCEQGIQVDIGRVEIWEDERVDDGNAS